MARGGFQTIGQRSIGPATPAAIFRRELEPLAEVLRELFASNHAGCTSASCFAARLSRLVLLQSGPYPDLASYEQFLRAVAKPEAFAPQSSS